MTVNSFSVMDNDEKRAHLGLKLLNSTKTQEKTSSESLLGSMSKHPDTLSWYSMGFVTESFDQADCGACWTFPAVALLEFALKEATGKLIQLSNQELLDCTYEFNKNYGDHDGCDGGLYEHAWDMIIATQHLAPLVKYRYKEADYKCDHKLYSNALEGNVKLKGYRAVDMSEEGLLDAVQLMPLAVAIYAEDELFAYGGGMYDGCLETHLNPDHAVLLTGYGTNYWEVRNSWGPDWGINGFWKFFRGSGPAMCFLLDYAAYITYDNLRDGTDAPGEDTDPPIEPTNTATTSSYLTTVSKQSPTTEPPTDPPTPDSTAVSKPDSTTEEVGSSTTSPPTRPLTTEQMTTTSSVPVTEPMVECEAGQYWTGAECAVCEANTYSGQGAKFCVSCPEGTTSQEGAGSADDCLEDQCQDSYSDCAKWARKGHCVDGEYISFMENNCRKSCFFCEEYCEAGYYRDFESGHCVICPENTYSAYKSGRCEPCPVGSTSLPGSTDVSNCEQEEVCQDTKSLAWCMMYVPYGYCDTNRRSMEKRCAKSCGFCSDECDGDCADDCRDKYETEICQRLKEKRYCYDPDYIDRMRKFCGKTCGTCREEEEDVNCVDDPEYAADCPQWAAVGYCAYDGQYTGFMHVSCKRSCHEIVNICSEGEPTTPTPTTRKLTEEELTTTTQTTDTTSCWKINSGISDDVILSQPEFTNYNDCLDLCKATASCKGVMVSPAYWAYRECFILGEERMGTRFGWTAAKRECFEPGYSEVTVMYEECADNTKYAEDCPSWADRYCWEGEYVGFMREHCPRSCGFCAGVSDCSDVAEHAVSCPIWRDEGYCTNTTYREWMSENCPMSCGVCGEEQEQEDCADKKKHAEDCPYWESQGYCTEGTYVGFMRQNCASSCNLCGRAGGGGRGRGKGRGKHRQHG